MMKGKLQFSKKNNPKKFPSYEEKFLLFRK